MFFRSYPDIALFIVRCALGSTMILHGAQKVFGAFGGQGISGFVTWLGTLGVPPLLAYVGTFAELIGGLMVLLGIGTRWGALLIAAQMGAALYLVHSNHGYFAQAGGFEYPLNLFLIALALVVGGPGCWYIW